jgi:catechol 2,3-dioxygenase-like lactoylglutathione lyase family enzyme
MATTLELPTISTPTTSRGIRFHLSLNVANLERSIAFFQTLFGREPAKCRPDYAKFELDDPPLVLSLEPQPPQGAGALNHLGFRMPDSAALVEVQRRLELSGISTRREEGVECCYARQTKFWVHDPDGNMWEVYTLEEDLEHRGDGRLPAPTPKDVDGRPAALWKHRLGQPLPARLPILDGTVDHVYLEGTFNERVAPEKQAARLVELLRILKPGGLLSFHGLTADQDLRDAPLRLPGPAAAVQFVPATDALLAQLANAGFQQPRITFRGAHACLEAAGMSLHETRLEARKAE